MPAGGGRPRCGVAMVAAAAAAAAEAEAAKGGRETLVTARE